MNILLVTLDQFRGDCLSAAGNPAQTPHLDRLADEGVRFTRHYAQASPCGPGRASLYTGMYQMNHRVVANGTPLDARFDNIAHAARRAGYIPTLFGYTDQAIDPRVTSGPADPRLESYEEVLPGFDVGLHLPMGKPAAWLQWLRQQGHAISDDPLAVLATESERPAEHSMSAFLAGRFIDWLGQRRAPWFAHLSQLRPHSPYAAAGRFARMYDPAEMPKPIVPASQTHWLHTALLAQSQLRAPADQAAMAELTAQYFGMVSEADHQLGRVLETLVRLGMWDDTFIVVTSDHGEQLGDHGLVAKYGYFEASYHIPAIVRDPRQGRARGRVVTHFTENVDILPTLCEAMEIPVPLQCDGLPLTPFLADGDPPWWRDAAHWEFDWRFGFIPHGPHAWPWDRRLERQLLAVRRDADSAFVQFGDGSFVCFDLAADATWRTPLREASRVAASAQALLAWRMQHAERTLTGMLVEKGGIGRWPAMPDNWGRA